MPLAIGHPVRGSRVWEKWSAPRVKPRSHPDVAIARWCNATRIGSAGTSVVDQRRSVDLHPPRAAVRLDAVAPQFAADLHQRVVNPKLAQRFRHQIDRKSLGDATEIKRSAIGSTQAAGAGIEVELPPSAFSVASSNLIRPWRRGARAARAKTPEIDQRSHGGVVGPAGFRRDAQRAHHDAAEFRWQILPLVQRQAVKPADVGLAFPRAHLRDHALEGQGNHPT